MTPTTARWLLAATLLFTIGCDRVTKHVATATLAGLPGRSYLGDTFRLGYAENSGGFLSLGATLAPGVRIALFTCATGVILTALLAALIRSRWTGWPAFGLALFIAGGLSNWIDRLSHGSVVDFMNVGIGPVRTGVFNLADVAIMTGAALFVLGEVWPWRSPTSSRAADGS